VTAVGNEFMIRHSETDQVPIADSGPVDYLFHRMFSLVMLILRATEREAWALAAALGRSRSLPAAPRQPAASAPHAAPAFGALWRRQGLVCD
jgi:hypothetical protein